VTIVDTTGQVDTSDVVVAPRLPLAADRAVGSASPAVKALLDDALLDEMVARVRADGARLTGPGSFLSEMCKAVLERGLQAELGEHLGYERHDAAGKGSGNSRNCEYEPCSASVRGLTRPATGVDAW
jgi:putative transposase